MYPLFHVLSKKKEYTVIIHLKITIFTSAKNVEYRNYPKISDRLVLENSAGYSLFAILFAPFWWNSLKIAVFVWILGRLQKCFLVPKI